ncbi:MAG: hypothetical protein ABR562_03720 [Thermoplasmatota archaeon]
MQLRRIRGGLIEVLDLPGGGVETHFNQAFEVPDSTVNLVLDGSGRFEAADAASQAIVDAEVEAREERARLAAAAKAAPADGGVGGVRGDA